MSKAPPAFQFYPDVFEQGTDTMTLAEVGGYMRLLNSQWAKGSVPGHDIGALSRIMRCTPAVAKSIWKAIGEKFQKGGDGLYRNARMENEREKQKARRAALADNGRKGGEAKAALRQLPQQQPDQKVAQEPQQKGSLPSPFPSSDLSQFHSIDLTTSNPSSGASSSSSSSLITSPLRYAKAMEKHAFYGSRLRVPHVLHDELRAKLGGLHPDTVLQVWYRELDVELEQSGEAIVDVFVWLRPKFVEWAAEFVASAELERFRPKGA